MADVRSKLKGLAFRLSLSILSAATLLIAGILYYNYHVSKKLLLESARETAEQLTHSTMTRMESVLISTQRVPEALLLFLDRGVVNEKSTYDILRFVLQNKPEIFASSIAFAPYSFRPDTEGYASYCYRTDTGFVFKNLADESYDYFDQNWFASARDSGQAIWTEPYFDRGGGNILMTTYAAPFYHSDTLGKTFRGVATADLSLNWLEDMMNYIQVFETGYVYLVSGKGTIITHPHKQFQMQNFTDLAKKADNPGILKIAERMMAGEEGYLPFISMIDQRPCWMYFATLRQTGWHMAVVFPEEELFAGLHQLYLYTVFMGILAILLLSFVVILFSARITKPLRRLTLTAGEIGKGNFSVEIHEDRSTREIAMLGSALSRMQSELKDYIRNLEETTSAKERFESELNIAHDIQQGMIPKIFPPFPEREDIDIYALLKPARQVGGDFYDFFFLDEETLCFAIGDVSDKGVPASLLMAMTITLFRAKAGLGQEVNELVGSINRDISKDNVNLMFVTFFMGMLNLRTGEMDYCNAGHNYPLLIRKNSETMIISGTHGPPLGVNEQQIFQSGKHTLTKEDTLVLYTDGITEAISIDGNFYGDDRLMNLLCTKCRERNPREISMTLINDVETFARTPEQSDDITLLVISYYPCQ